MKVEKGEPTPYPSPRDPRGEASPRDPRDGIIDAVQHQLERLAAGGPIFIKSVLKKEGKV